MAPTTRNPVNNDNPSTSYGPSAILGYLNFNSTVDDFGLWEIRLAGYLRSQKLYPTKLLLEMRNLPIKIVKFLTSSQWCWMISALD